MFPSASRRHWLMASGAGVRRLRRFEYDAGADQRAYSCGAQIIPGLLKYGDVPEIGSLIEPRPCIWEVGSHDRLIPSGWLREAVGRMARTYRALGAEERLVVDRFEGHHEWHGEVAYSLLEGFLQ